MWKCQIVNVSSDLDAGLPGDLLGVLPIGAQVVIVRKVTTAVPVVSWILPMSREEVHGLAKAASLEQRAHGRGIQGECTTYSPDG